VTRSEYRWQRENPRFADVCRLHEYSIQKHTTGPLQNRSPRGESNPPRAAVVIAERLTFEHIAAESVVIDLLNQGERWSES
jgi:hypothetical protein